MKCDAIFLFNQLKEGGVPCKKWNIAIWLKYVFTFVRNSKKIASSVK